MRYKVLVAFSEGAADPMPALPLRGCAPQARDCAMNMILFSTLKGAPIAFLLLSEPTSQGQNCVFVVAARDAQTLDSPEGQVLLPDLPTEYVCSFTSGPSETRVEFKNQNGWHFVVRLDGNHKGEWSATKGTETLSGLASAP